MRVGAHITNRRQVYDNSSSPVPDTDTSNFVAFAMTPHNNQKSYRQFRNIRNRISRLNGEDLLRHAITQLHHADAADIKRQKYYGIWDLLLLVKWTIMYGDFSNYRRYEHVTEYQFNILLNRIKDLSAVVRGFRTERELVLYVRHLAFQQFWTQQGESLPLGVARQYVAFGSLDENHSFNRMFLEKTGISISDFLELSIPLITYLLNKRQPYVALDWFQPVQDSYGIERLINYFGAISKSVDDAREWLRLQEQERLESGMGVDDEYFEPTPFLRFPILQAQEKYFVISPDLLLESLSTYVYDKLRDIDANSFMSRFGRIFESLVERSLRSVVNDIFTETDLVRYFGQEESQRLVDFLIVQDGCNILVEAKGVVMNVKGIIADKPGTVRQQSKSSVLKGLDQAYHIASQLRTKKELGGRPVGTRDNYLLIVTFKDLNLGQGQEFRDFIAPVEVDKIIGKYGGQQWIPLSNVFILSIDNFDAWLGVVAGGAFSLKESLANAVKYVKSTRAWNPFRQMFVDNPDYRTVLPYLEEGRDELFGRVIEKCEF